MTSQYADVTSYQTQPSPQASNNYYDLLMGGKGFRVQHCILYVFLVCMQ